VSLTPGKMSKRKALIDSDSNDSDSSDSDVEKVKKGLAMSALRA